MDLVNSEDESFSFSFSLSSLVAEDQVSRLTVEPMSGTVGPKERSKTHRATAVLKLSVSWFSSTVNSSVAGCHCRSSSRPAVTARSA